MFVHPLCACTPASIAGLESLAARVRPFPADIAFVLFHRTGLPDNGKFDRLLPSSRIFVDEDGAEARRFRAIASGTVLLYSANGNLLFHGGITGSRGHRGGNFGLTQLGDLLASHPAHIGTPVTSPVFGCALADENPEATGVRQ